MQAVVDEAYGALRDLECEVHYVKVNEEGKVEPMYEQFGNTKTKMNFNPVWDEADDFDNRVVQEARAPFARDDDSDDDLDKGPSNTVPFSAQPPQPPCCDDEHHSH